MLAKPTMWWPGIRKGHPLARGLVALWPMWEGGGGASGNIVDPERYRMLHFNTPTWTGSEIGTGLLFDDGSSEYAESSGIAPVTAVPLTLAAWFNTDASIAGRQTPLCLSDISSFEDFRIDLTGNEEVRATAFDGGDAAATTSNTYSLNSWNHAVAIFAAANDRTAILNRDLANKGTNNTAKTPTGIDTVSAGRRALNGGNSFGLMSGLLAMPAIWNRALPDAAAVELYEDPWGLITPRQKTYVFFQAPAVTQTMPIISDAGIHSAIFHGLVISGGQG